MEAAIVILLLVIGAVGGGLIVHAWKSDGKERLFHDDTEHGAGPIL